MLVVVMSVTNDDLVPEAVRLPMFRALLLLLCCCLSFGLLSLLRLRRTSHDSILLMLEFRTVLEQFIVRRIMITWIF